MMRRLGVVCGLLAAATVAACIIGPKQDDPFNDPIADTGPLDAFAREDVGLGLDDSTTSTDPEVGNHDEAGADAASDTRADAKGETCPDGGVALTAVGPWNEAEKCWKGSVVFDCVSSIDGGAAETCFARISTDELFLATSTHIPSGSDYRLCNDDERARVKSATELCEK